MKLPPSEKRSWYLVKGAGPRQWFDETSLEAVLAVAVLMTGMGPMSGTDEVTLEDADKKPIVTFLANENHKGCRFHIPVGSDTTVADLQDLKHFMTAYGML